MLGKMVAETFEEAAEKWANQEASDKSLFSKEKMTYWGCRLYDNEGDARESFG